jgi:hypothetical protein
MEPEGWTAPGVTEPEYASILIMMRMAIIFIKEILVQRQFHARFAEETEIYQISFIINQIM